ncbi:MAG: porin [Arcobacter sp.]|uniref:porin n=1 Tax=Arcobacter sp. TaxID=1872629 RepID=UPI003B001551
MKKFVKLSLVAAVAVTGLTTANAQPLEEAIKGVDVSGTVAYRYDDRDTNSSNITTNSYKIAINTKSKINDDVTFNARTIIGAGGNNGAMAVINSNVTDSNAAFSLTQANFAYTGIANTTIIAGKQTVPSPFAVAADAAGDEDTGNGITGITTVGPVTLAGTYLQNTNLVTAGAAIAGLGVLANVGPVALDAWYLDVTETSATNDGHKAYTIGASSKIEMVSLYARYSAVEPDVTSEKESLWKVGAKAKFGIVGLSVDYGKTNDVTTYQRGVNLTGDADAAVNLQGWALNLNTDDSSLIKVGANVDVMEGVNLSATYLDKDAGAAADSDEIYGQVTYKMGKNLMTYVRIGEHQTTGAAKGTRGRLHVQYSF